MLSSGGYPVKHTQKGFTLIELMIALLLGLIFSAAAFQLLFSNQRMLGLQQTLASLQEDGQMALRYMTNDIRNAGRGSILQGTITPVILDPDAIHGHSQNGNAGDELVIQYFGTSDCQGTTSASEVEIINRYYVNQGMLLCSGNLSNGTVELLDGVENFQVQYGLDTDKDDNLAVTQFVNASEAMLDADEHGNPPVLAAIRLAILLHSAELNNSAPSASSTHYVLDQQVTSDSDRRIRRVFSTTIHIRNFDSEGV